QGRQPPAHPRLVVDLVVRLLRWSGRGELSRVDIEGLAPPDATPVVGGQVPADAEQVAGELRGRALEAGDLGGSRQPRLGGQVLGRDGRVAARDGAQPHDQAPGVGSVELPPGVLVTRLGPRDQFVVTPHAVPRPSSTPTVAGWSERPSWSAG